MDDEPVVICPFCGAGLPGKCDFENVPDCPWEESEDYVEQLERLDEWKEEQTKE